MPTASVVAAAEGADGALRVDDPELWEPGRGTSTSCRST